MLRGERVILDMHLAELYGVETRTLKQAVKRNWNRFPEDFMFELSNEEVDLVVSQSVIPSKKHLGGALPYAFTESGVAMMSGVLKSQRAIEMNIAIMRTFVAIRKFALNYQELLQRMDAIELSNEIKFAAIFKAINQLVSPKNKRRPIGFKSGKK
jgi:hypothetical protein